MAEKMYKVGPHGTRLFLRAESVAGVHFGVGYERYELGTHYDKVWFKDTKRKLYLNFLFWKLEIVHVRVRPVETN